MLDPYFPLFSVGLRYFCEVSWMFRGFGKVFVDIILLYLTFAFPLWFSHDGPKSLKNHPKFPSLLSALAGIYVLGDALNILNILGLIFCCQPTLLICFRPGQALSYWCGDSPSRADCTSFCKKKNDHPP